MKNDPVYSDEYWMGHAIAEAVKARGHTSPNPMVGAVLLRKGRRLAVGYHHRAGLPHAEIEALKQVKDPRGATLYVTLEPCCHEGKRTPPCTEAILRSGIKKVIVGTLDPNPKVSGKGVKILRRAGIDVEVGILEEECRAINVFYNHWITTGKPWVVMKTAASLDGRIALANGKSRWITGEASRACVHQLRSEVDGILVGVGTVEADDPELTARHRKGLRQPIRVILDPSFRISIRAKVLDPRADSPCWIIVAPGRISAAKREQVQRRNAEVIVAPLRRNGEFDLTKLLHLLGKRGMVSLLVEGGPKVWTSFHRQNAFQELWAFVAPKLLGADAKSMLAPFGLTTLQQKFPLQLSDVEVFGEDVLMVYRRPRTRQN